MPLLLPEDSGLSKINDLIDFCGLNYEPPVTLAENVGLTADHVRTFRDNVVSTFSILN
jgi:hypothetical protein